MSYRETCDGCGKSGVVPQQDETLTSGTLLHQVPSDESKKASYRSKFTDSEEERAKAEKRMEHISKWDHFCGDCIDGNTNDE